MVCPVGDHPSPTVARDFEQSEHLPGGVGWSSTFRSLVRKGTCPQPGRTLTFLSEVPTT